MNKTISTSEFLKKLTLEEYIELFGSYWDRNTKKFERFKLWPRQKKYCTVLEANQIVLTPKSRQKGCSEVGAERVCKSIMENPNTEIVVISKSEEFAQYFLEYRILRKLNNLPNMSQISWPTIVEKTKSQIKLSNGSVVKSLTSSQSSAASMSLDGIVFDEAGGIDENYGNFKQLFANAWPTLTQNKNAWAMVIGTSVPGSYYNTMVEDAYKSSDSPFELFFFSWKDQPGRDRVWYEREKEILKEDIYLQHPETIEDFFYVKDGLVFKTFDSKEGGVHVNFFNPRDKFGFDFYVVYDHGYRHPAGALFALYDPYDDFIWIFDEVYFEQDHQSDVATIGQKIKNKMLMCPKRPRKMIADTAIFNRTNGEMTTAKMFKRFCGINFSKSNKHNESSSRQLLSQRFTMCKIMIHPSCVNLKEELMTHRWANDGERPQDKNNDLLDALRYLCAEVNKRKKPSALLPPEAYSKEKAEKHIDTRRMFDNMLNSDNMAQSGKLDWLSV